MANINMEIVTGSTGSPHVTPIDDAVRNTNTGYYGDTVVFDVFDKFAAQARTANLVRISSGYGMIHGRYFRIAENAYDECIIENCAQNQKRMDLIVARYEKSGGIESIKPVVIKGSQGNAYVEPSSYNSDNVNINSNAEIFDFPLYKVYIDGIVIDHLESCFTPLPDGGRLGQIESDFEEIQTAFNDLQNQIDSLPQDISDAASKSYVNTQINQMGANKANKYHTYSSSEVNSNRSSIIGTASVCGHLKCSDNYTDVNTESEAAGGVAFSQKGARAMYNELMTAFTDGCNGIATKLISKGVAPTKGENTVNYTPQDFMNAISRYKRKVHYKITISRNASGSAGTVTVVIGSTTNSFNFKYVSSPPPSGMPQKAYFSDKTWTQNV